MGMGSRKANTKAHVVDMSEPAEERRAKRRAKKKGKSRGEFVYSLRLVPLLRKSG